jgi:hypothetical protein
MRLSGLAVAVLFLFSSILLAQHSSGVFSSGGGFHSSSGSIGGHASSGSSHSASGAAHASSGATHNSGDTAMGARDRSTKAAALSAAKLEKRHFFSFPWHKKPTLQHAYWQTRPCVKGHNCVPCAPGSHGAAGMCTPQPPNVLCLPGQGWNGLGCTPQTWWVNDCTALAAQLEAQKRHMRGLNDPGQSLIYQVLRNQYLSCLARGGLGVFSFYAFNDPSIFYTP